MAVQAGNHAKCRKGGLPLDEEFDNEGNRAMLIRIRCVVLLGGSVVGGGVGGVGGYWGN